MGLHVVHDYFNFSSPVQGHVNPHGASDVQRTMHNLLKNTFQIGGYWGITEPLEFSASGN